MMGFDLKVENTVKTQPSSNPIIDLPREIFQDFANAEGALIFGGFGLLLLVRELMGDGRNKRLSTGKMAGKGELIRAAKMSLLQMGKGKCAPSTLWAGTPKYWLGKNFFSAALQISLGAAPTTFFPDAGRGILALGVPGSGKTFSVIDRIVESAYAQGFSGILYDKKGDQLALHFPLALMYGYGDKERGGRIDVIAPGRDYSGVFNPLEVMRDAEDAVMASQIGKVVIENSGLKSNRSDSFFESCGQSLATGMVQLAKSSQKYPDLALVYALFKLDKLTQRLDYAINRSDNKRMNPWIAVNFATFLSSKDAEKTVAGIKTQAQVIYTCFMQKDLLRCFIGESTVPLRLEGKQLIIFELDDKRRGVIAPLLATLIQLAVVENLASKRSNPFFYALDELPSLVLKDLVRWINEYRSHGGVPIVGIQFLQQLYEVYGKETGDAIAFALKTHVIFDPGALKTAEEYSNRFGKKDIIVKNMTVNSSNGSISRSVSSQIHQVPLISADRILRFPQGKCIISSPGYGNEHETGFPYLAKIPIPNEDKKRAQLCEELWASTYIEQLRARAKKRTKDIDPTEELRLREIEAKQLLPLPDEENLDSSQGIVADDEPDEFERFLDKRAALAKN